MDIDLITAGSVTESVAVLGVAKTSTQSVALFAPELQKTIQTFLANFMSSRTQEAYVSDWREFFFIFGRPGTIDFPLK